MSSQEESNADDYDWLPNISVLWERIVRGEWGIIDLTRFDGRLALLLRRRDTSLGPRRLTGREIEVVQHAARGRSDKWIAYELGVSRSTVATHLGKAMAKLGIVHRTHLGLLRFLFDGGTQRPDALSIKVSREELMSLSFDQALQPRDIALTEAEVAVATLAVEGWSNREIASRREVSQRTVANQLRSVYEKCGVSSRTELAASLGA